MRENLLLVIPRYHTYGNNGHYVMPLGILYVSAYLKRERVAQIFTLNLNHVDGNEKEVLRRIMRQRAITAFGVGGLSGEYQDLKRMMVYAKEIDSGVTTILGGGIVTADPEATMEAFPEVDYGIIGEGELTLTELLQGADPQSINGLIYRKDGALVKTAPREEIMDLDSLPIPDYEGFDYDEYLRNNPDLTDEGKRYSQVSVVGGRSCKYCCTFCFHPSGTTYRQRSLDSIFAEIDYLVSHYDISYIALREELFATNNIRVAEFCRHVERYDFDWSIQLRIDNVNEELVSLLRNTRCRYIFLGIESASNTVLRSMRKGITLQQIEKACEMLTEAGLNFRSGVIMGDPAETEESARSTIDWYLRNCNRYRLYIDMIIAFPGSAIYQYGVSSGRIPDKVRFLQESCPIVNLTTMDNEAFRQMVQEVEHLNGRIYKLL